MPNANEVPIAAPLVPYAGIGPSPRMRITLKVTLSTVVAMPSAIGVRASPAERRAPASIKKIIMPRLNTNIVRRNGSASACTAAEAFTMPSRCGASQ